MKEGQVKYINGNIIYCYTSVVATLVFLKYQLNKFSVRERDGERGTDR